MQREHHKNNKEEAIASTEPESQGWITQGWITQVSSPESEKSSFLLLEEAELQMLEKADISIIKERVLGKAMADKFKKCVETITDVVPEMLEIADLDYGKMKYIKKMEVTDRKSVV